MKEDLMDCFIGKLYDEFRLNFESCEEVNEAEDKVYKLYWNNDLFDNNLKFDLEDSITRLERKYEKQGFIQGFKQATEVFACYLDMDFNPFIFEQVDKKAIKKAMETAIKKAKGR